MQVTFWGTRGSIAKAGPSTLRYGGNTSCVEVRSDAGTIVVLDCGTGAHGLGQDLVARSGDAPMEGHLLIGHTHWDHIQGLPFFAPLFRPDSTWHIYGPRGLGGSISEVLAGQMQYAYFPVAIEQLTATVDYHDLVESTFDIDDIRVTSRYLNHPALTLGYRLEVDGATVVYSTDHEPHDRRLAAGGDPATSRHDLDHAALFAGADLLIHDAQYLAEEYPDKVGWGHSTVEYVVSVAHQAGVKQVALFHHDPARSDDAVEDVVARSRAFAAELGFAGEIIAAAERDTIELRGTPSSVQGAAWPIPKPALDHMARSVLLAVRSPEIATVLRQAAKEEDLEVWEATDQDEAVEIARRERPAIIVIEDQEDGAVLAEFADAIAVTGKLRSGGSTVIAVTADGHRSTGGDPVAITDVLEWPATAGHVRTKLRAWLLRRACRWQTAPLPHDEAARLRALHDLEVLDTDPEPRFDRYTDLASSTFDVPVALITLIDEDRQWFKSRHGIDVAETSRDMAVCAYTILGGDVFQVPDAFADPRFADNPLVASGPRFRFYAGAPLTLADGTRAGTLCVVDRRPRLLDDDQLAELTRLAALVTAELEADGPRASSD